ncbi:MAG: HAD family hydrolase [Armatimonadetes bacterium]|nr:HAD family hydrolase [Armatimonadota bacterium]
MRAWPPLLLFDLDDTLFDHRGSSQLTLAALGEAWPALRRLCPEQLWGHYHRILEELHTRVMRGQMSVDESRALRAQRLFAECGESLAATEAERFALEFREAYQRLRFPVADAARVLGALRQTSRIGIVSNNFTAEQEDKLRWCQLDHLIDFMVTSEDAGSTKPDPAIFQVALAAGGVGVDEAILVGDNWEVDIVGALGVGLRAVWFDRVGEPRELPAGVERITALAELLG